MQVCLSTLENINIEREKINRGSRNAEINQLIRTIENNRYSEKKKDNSSFVSFFNEGKMYSSIQLLVERERMCLFTSSYQFYSHNVFYYREVAYILYKISF